MGADRHSLRASDKLSSSEDSALSVRWPLALSQRLDALLARAGEAGERTTRKELLAALFLSLNPEDAEMSAILRSYRKAIVGDAVLDVSVDDNVIELAAHRPGPRSKR